jgi:hypothetical protein
MRLHSMDFPDQQWTEIQAEARRKGISAADLIRRTMDVYLMRTISLRLSWMASDKTAARLVPATPANTQQKKGVAQ